MLYIFFRFTYIKFVQTITFKKDISDISKGCQHHKQMYKTLEKYFFPNFQAFNFSKFQNAIFDLNVKASSLSGPLTLLLNEKHFQGIFLSNLSTSI